MTDTFITDGNQDTIIQGVGMTLDRTIVPDSEWGSFGDLGEGFQRNWSVDVAKLDGLLSGAGIIGYFTETALSKKRPQSNHLLLTELIASGPRHDVVLPPLFRNTPASLKEAAPPHQLSIEDQHALFVRILGRDWKKKVAQCMAERSKIAI